MSNILVGKPVNGISLNGLEYLLDENGSEPLRFRDEEKAKAFLRENGLDANTIDSLHFVREKRENSFCPSDAKLNAKMAEVCGRSKETGNSLPDYCNDRNALSEIWAVLEANKKGKTHAVFVMTMMTGGIASTLWPALQTNLWLLVTAPPRFHVEAALHILGHWRNGWIMSQKEAEIPPVFPMPDLSEDESNLLEMQSLDAE